MVYNQVHIPLSQEIETGAFWNDHPEYGVCIFNTAFLLTAHRVTVEDTGAFFSVYAGSQRTWVAEFRSPVCMDGME